MTYYVHVVFETGEENKYDIEEKFDKLPKENDISYWIKRKYCPNCGCMMIDEPEMKCEED